jgi:hypothetical protein
MLDEDNETIILNNPDLSDEELEELFALKALHHNYDVITNVMAFEKFVFAVNGIIPNFERVDIPNLLMVASALKKAERVLQRQLKFEEPNEHTTKVYIAHIAHEDGFVIMPRCLSFAQEELNKITHGGHIFADITNDFLEKTKPWDAENAVSVHCAKTQAVVEWLRLNENRYTEVTSNAN